MLNTKTELPDMTAAYQEVQEKKKERWQDDDGDGKWYEKSDTDGKISKREKEEKKKNQKEEVEVVDEAMLLTRADKKGNTPAWQNRDKKNPKTGEPIYKKADHLKKEEAEHMEEDCASEAEGAPEMAKGGYIKGKKKVKKEEFEALKDSGLFTEEELNKIIDLDTEGE